MIIAVDRMGQRSLMPPVVLSTLMRNTSSGGSGNLPVARNWSRNHAPDDTAAWKRW